MKWQAKPADTNPLSTLNYVLNSIYLYLSVSLYLTHSSTTTTTKSLNISLSISHSFASLLSKPENKVMQAEGLSRHV